MKIDTPTTQSPVPAGEIDIVVTATEARSTRSDARRNRERILNAARHLFAEEGTQVSIEDIAREAGVGVGTVYRHFASKSDLVQALTQARFDRLAEWMDEALEAENPWEGFVNFMHRAGEMQHDDRAFLAVISSSPGFAEGCAEISGLMAGTMRLLSRAKSRGYMREDLTPEDVGMAICSLGMAAEITANGGPGSWERVLELILDGMRPTR